MLISPLPDQEGNKLQRPNSNFCKPLRKKSRKLSVQPGLCGSNDLRVGRQMSTFQLFIQSGLAKDLSVPLYQVAIDAQYQTNSVWSGSLSSTQVHGGQNCDMCNTFTAISSPTEVVFYIARWHEVNLILITRDVRKHNEYTRPVCNRDVVAVTETCSSRGRSAVSYWYSRTKTWALYCFGAVSQNSFRMHLCDVVLSYNFKVRAMPVFPSFSSTENHNSKFS